MHVFVNNPYWQISGINFEQILYSYQRYTDKLFHVFFLLVAVILLEPHENPRKKD